MADETRKQAQDGGPSLANASLNSSRRSGTDETGTGNPARDSDRRDTTEATKVPDQQVPDGTRR